MNVECHLECHLLLETKRFNPAILNPLLITCISWNMICPPLPSTLSEDDAPKCCHSCGCNAYGKINQKYENSASDYRTAKRRFRKATILCNTDQDRLCFRGLERAVRLLEDGNGWLQSGNQRWENGEKRRACGQTNVNAERVRAEAVGDHAFAQEAKQQAETARLNAERRRRLQTMNTPNSKASRQKFRDLFRRGRRAVGKAVSQIVFTRDDTVQTPEPRLERAVQPRSDGMSSEFPIAAGH